MPKYFKQNLLSKQKELPSPLSDPELPSGHYSELETIRTLLEWKAPARPFRKKGRSFYTTVAIIIILVSLIALLAGQILLIGALFAFCFLVYVLNFIPPEEVTNKISTQGITTSNHFYHWEELDSFWFSEKDGFTLLHVVTSLRFPVILVLVLTNVNEDQVKNTIAHYLPFHEIAPKTFFDKWSDSLQKHFPLENP